MDKHTIQIAPDVTVEEEGDYVFDINRIEDMGERAKLNAAIALIGYHDRLQHSQTTGTPLTAYLATVVNVKHYVHQEPTDVEC